MRISIVGITGYSGMELLRILLDDAGVVLVDVVAVSGESFGFEEGVAKHVWYVLAVRQYQCEEMIEDVHAHRRGAPACIEDRKSVV